MYNGVQVIHFDMLNLFRDACNMLSEISFGLHYKNLCISMFGVR